MVLKRRREQAESPKGGSGSDPVPSGPVPEPATGSCGAQGGLRRASGALGGLESLGARREGPGIGTPCTAGAMKKAVLDRNGVAIHVGDRIRAKARDGRVAEWVVGEAHWEYGSVSDPNTPFGVVIAPGKDSRFPGALVCQERFEDWQGARLSASEAWAEVVEAFDPARAGEPYVPPAVACPDEFPATLYDFGTGAGRAWTPQTIPGFSEEERRLVSELVEANHCRYLASVANQGLPALRSNISDGQVKAALASREAEATFRKRWGKSALESLKENNAIYKGHPLVGRFRRLKRGEEGGGV